MPSAVSFVPCENPFITTAITIRITAERKKETPHKKSTRNTTKLTKKQSQNSHYNIVIRKNILPSSQPFYKKKPL